mgnify:CR=1 FL=1
MLIPVDLCINIGKKPDISFFLLRFHHRMSYYIKVKGKDIQEESKIRWTRSFQLNQYIQDKF